MTDGPIDQMLRRRVAFLRDIIRSGGRDSWDHLRTHGHHHGTRDSCLRLGYIEGDKQRFSLTKDGELCAAQLPGVF